MLLPICLFLPLFLLAKSVNCSPKLNWTITFRNTRQNNEDEKHLTVTLHKQSHQYSNGDSYEFFVMKMKIEPETSPPEMYDLKLDSANSSSWISTVYCRVLHDGRATKACHRQGTIPVPKEIKDIQVGQLFDAAGGHGLQAKGKLTPTEAQGKTGDVGDVKFGAVTLIDEDSLETSAVGVIGLGNYFTGTETKSENYVTYLKESLNLHSPNYLLDEQFNQITFGYYAELDKTKGLHQRCNTDVHKNQQVPYYTEVRGPFFKVSQAKVNGIPINTTKIPIDAYPYITLPNINWLHVPPCAYKSLHEIYKLPLDCQKDTIPSLDLYIDEFQGTVSIPGSSIYVYIEGSGCVLKVLEHPYHQWILGSLFSRSTCTIVNVANREFTFGKWEPFK